MTVADTALASEMAMLITDFDSVAAARPISSRGAICLSA